MNLTSYLDRFGCIKIDVNIDGLPVFINPPMKFWPILGRLVETLDNPFIIGIFYGSSDPVDLNLYLGDFRLEIQELQDEGFSFKGQISFLC